MFNDFYNNIPKASLIFIILFTLVGCAPQKVTKKEDVCEVYNKNFNWYRSAVRAQNKYHIDANIIMAVMAQESNFTYNARPQKNYVFNFVPWGYKTSARGYAQVIDGAWDDYKKQTNQWFPSRHSFNDACDYVGWYLNKASKRLHINRNDSYHLYLAYHQGLTGYKRHDEKHDQKLNLIAKKVQKNTQRYQSEFKQCKNSLWLKHWLYVWDY
ncbi:MAG: transglycosylase SLT domain-containing protein [Pseudomonadota bacterium]|nr:transglycosylase SLT domain-containing protein [Pseudomonadota bacterium]